jgi:hypothetical protein
MNRRQSAITGILVICSAVAPSCGAEEILGPPGGALELVQPAAIAYTLVPAQAVVQVVDKDGEPFERAGIVVTANVESGDAKVVAGGTAVTNALGKATFSLKIGAREATGGDLELVFSSRGLEPAVQSSGITCRIHDATAGSPLTSALEDGDCLDSGARYKLFDESGSLEGRKAVRMTMTAGFAPALYFRKSAYAEEPYFGFAADTSARTASLKMLLPAEQVRFWAGSAVPDRFGSFSLSVNRVPEHEVGCEDVFVRQPISTTQVIEAACTDGGGMAGDFFPILLYPHWVLRVTVTSTAFTPGVSLWRVAPNALVAQAVGSGSTASISYEHIYVPEPGRTPWDIYYVFVGAISGTPGPYSVAFAHELPTPLARSTTVTAEHQRVRMGARPPTAAVSGIRVLPRTRYATSFPEQ